ncbi:hypothetical protein AtEden1_Chr2g0231691 [Arabidopsis thaliana]
MDFLDNEMLDIEIHDIESLHHLLHVGLFVLFFPKFFFSHFQYMHERMDHL